ncbi:MAG: glycosyltransferase family 2 protein [Oligoflexia bacterium]|nr:glycosyltransferase family 2 protein [Oligoflexia bacterium]
MTFISVILPCYNESENIPLVYDRLKNMFAQNNFEYEIIFVNDGSLDHSQEIVENLVNQDKNVIGISLGRNFGHQNALSAGIDYANGDGVILMDADLQDPPELIPEMIHEWQQGHEVVYAVRKNRKGEGFFKKITAALFYRIFCKIADTKIPLDTGDFRLLDRLVVENLKKMPEKTRFLRGMISWIGLRQTSVYFDRDERKHGNTNYPYTKMLKLALDGIFSFSSFPLKISSYFGILISITSFMLITYNLYHKMINNKNLLTGWSSLFISILFMGGIQLIFLGVIGEYMSRIFIEVKQRPLYVIKKISFNNMRRESQNLPYTAIY